MFVRKIHNLYSALRRQKQSLEELKKYQDKHLRSVLKYAYTHNRFYRALYKRHNVDISTIKTYADLPKLPIINKSDLQMYQKSSLPQSGLKYHQNTNHKNLIVRRTGGSTGKPLFVHFDKKAWDFSEAIYARSLLNTGYKSRELLINSNPFLIPEQKWYDKLGFFRKKQLSMSKSVESQLHFLYSQKEPFTFYTYPTLLKLLSKYVEPEKLKLNRIVATGELLTPQARKEIEEAFDTKIYNHYGTMEFNRVAWDCHDHDGMHIDMDSVALEFVKDNEHVVPGETGQTIMTNLHNYRFPLIRYNQGDYAVPSDEKNSCGIGLPLLKKLVGRDNDFIVLKNNERMSPIPLDVLLSHYEEVLQYQIIQKTKQHFELHVIKSLKFQQSVEYKILQKVRALLRNENIQITFYYHSEIRRSPGGKLRSVISLVRD